MSSRLFVAACMLAFTVLLTDCKKDVAGPQGDPGTPGKPGNLKQSHVSALKVKASSWSFNSDNYTWESLVFISDITRNVIEKGGVKAYLERDSLWYALPYGKGFLFTQCTIEEGIVRLNYSHIHAGKPDRPEDGTYRFVIFSPAK